MLVKLAFVVQRLKKISKNIFVMINKNGGGGGTMFRFYGGDTAVMRGDIVHGGGPPSLPPSPLAKTLKPSIQNNMITVILLNEAL